MRLPRLTDAYDATAATACCQLAPLVAQRLVIGAWYGCGGHNAHVCALGHITLGRVRHMSQHHAFDMTRGAAPRGEDRATGAAQHAFARPLTTLPQVRQIYSTCCPCAPAAPQFAQVPFVEAPQLLSILTSKLNVTLPYVVRAGILQVRACGRVGFRPAARTHALRTGHSTTATAINATARTCSLTLPPRHMNTQEAAAASEECVGTGNEVAVWSCVLAHMLHVYAALQQPAYTQSMQPTQYMQR